MHTEKQVLTVWRLTSVLVSITFLVLGTVLVKQGNAQAEEIIVYKSPACGCCNKWVEHLQDNGFTVRTRDQNNMNPIKKQFAISRPLQSCHTATIDGYVIEGHVPANDIRQLLRDRPDIKGLTVPGMPMGSPGMEGHRVDRYAVIAIDRKDNLTVFSQY